MRREEEIFERLASLSPAEDKEAILRLACAGDRELRQRVEQLLSAHQDAKELGFLNGSEHAKQATAIVPAQNDEGPGTVVGRYKLLQQIGEGGCGVVYMAEQQVPMKRRVALKVIKLGMDTRNVIARFEAERQALALMDHPNIAKVLDAGSTPSGRPYFVMELVRGVRITDYCDQNKLSTPQRLDLFLQVCRAIQHAHQKGIIHRDIKPSNVLVTLHDGVPVPKVIDFGISKATSDQRLTDKTLFTAFEQFIGTPAYMSPEQAEMSGLDIDTRSDIYGLGVLLYELLTGKTPFDAKELLAVGLDEMRRTIREKEPLRPSTRLSTMVEGELTATARHRQSDPAKLTSLLRGDLDWIVMKALEKDRARRYDTANGLAMDITRYLNSEPVIARPPSKLYRFQRLVRRNKPTFAAIGAVVLALIAGVLASSWQAIKATRAGRQAAAAQHRADQNAAQAERSELAARQRAYASDMGLAQRALAINNLGRAQELLDRNRPSSTQSDLRGWEWRYVWQQTRSDAQYIFAKRTTPISALAVSWDEKFVAIAEELNRNLSVWDLRTRQEVASLPAANGSVLAVFSPCEPLLAFFATTVSDTTNRQCSIRLWNSDSRKIIGELPLSGPTMGLQFSTDGRKLMCATTQHTRYDGPNDEITLWDVHEARLLKSFHVLQKWSDGISVASTSDLSVTVHGGPQGMLSATDMTTGKDRWSVKAADEMVTAVAISPMNESWPRVVASSNRTFGFGTWLTELKLGVCKAIEVGSVIWSSGPMARPLPLPAAIKPSGFGM
jgi:serine/threonine protein kinase